MSDLDLQEMLNKLYGLAEIITEAVVVRGSKNSPKGIDKAPLRRHNG